MYTAVLAGTVGAYFAGRLAGLPVGVATVWVASESGIDNNPVGLTSGGVLIVFDSWQHGIDAAVAWIENPASPYGALRAALKAGDPYTVMRAVQDSPWGPKGYYHSAWPNVARALGITLPTAPAVPAGGHPVTLQVVSSTPLPAGTTGHLRRGTRRWAHDGSSLPGLTSPAVVAIGSLDVLAGPIHGHFFQTETTPPYYVIAAAVPLDDLTNSDPGTPSAPPPTVVIPPTTPPVINAVYSQQDAAAIINELATLYPSPAIGEPQHTYTPAMALAQWVQIRKDGAQLPNVTGPGLRFTPGEPRNPFDAQTIDLGLSIAWTDFQAHKLTAVDLAAAMNILAAELAAGDYSIGGGGFLG